MITLKTLPQATAQEVFDQIATHLLTQNKKSETVGACVYKTQDGLRCAAGCLISDDEFKSEYNDKRWGYLVNLGFAPSAHWSLIRSMQCIHDSYNPEYWREKLLYHAEKNGLDPKAIYDLDNN